MDKEKAQNIEHRNLSKTRLSKIFLHLNKEKAQNIEHRNSSLSRLILFLIFDKEKAQNVERRNLRRQFSNN